MSDERFEVVIVGAGPAGAAAALVLARDGVEVLVLERGDFPGAKNLFEIRPTELIDISTRLPNSG